jgi:hypothetical protein
MPFFPVFLSVVFVVREQSAMSYRHLPATANSGVQA